MCFKVTISPVEEPPQYGTGKWWEICIFHLDWITRFASVHDVSLRAMDYLSWDQRAQIEKVADGISIKFKGNSDNFKDLQKMLEWLEKPNPCM